MADKLDLKLYESGVIPSEFKIWEQNMKSFDDISELNKDSPKQQITFFQNYISSEINIKINYTSYMTIQECVQSVLPRISPPKEKAFKLQQTAQNHIHLQ